jgi:alcohol dehydrogenase
MKALVYHGPGSKNWEEVPDPELGADTDAVVRVDATTICGTDLHILKGDVPEVTPGRILGHEAVGTVEQVGAGVKTLSVGDRVLVSCISACGSCRFCREGRYGQCTGGGGWILGHLIDGTQAEHVRVPFADTSTHRLPANASDEEILMLADILPTGYEVGVLNGRVSPGDAVAVVGAGPIGLSAITGAKLYSPSHVVAIDLADSRLEAAKAFGADLTVNNSREDAVAYVQGLTGGLGADVAIEAVGVPDSFELCTELVRPGGHVANIGVHGKPATLHLESLWTKDVTITTGLVDTYSTPTLLRLVSARQIDAARFATHHLGLADIEEAYDVYQRAADTGAIKVVCGPVSGPRLVGSARPGSSAAGEPATAKATVRVASDAGQPGVRAWVVEPTLEELTEALECSLDAEGAVPAGVARQLRRDNGWGGRLIDVLEVITESPETMGYLAGGRRPDEVVTWLAPWAESTLSIEEIRLVVASGGWDPEPFAVLARAGLLERFLLQPDGSPRRIRGELAGGWASDQLALASDDEVLRQVREVLDADAAPPPVGETTARTGEPP